MRRKVALIQCNIFDVIFTENNLSRQREESDIYNYSLELVLGGGASL